MKIGIFGLGYVGVVNVACFTKMGHTVWCTDVKANKTDQVAKGLSPINEPGVTELLHNAVGKGLLHASQNVEEVVRNCDLLMICVGTPSKADGEVNLGFLNNVMYEISSYLKPEDAKYIVLRSTVPPGTTEGFIQTYFSHFPNITTVFYPEFLRESSAIEDFFNYTRMIVGTRDKDNPRLTDLLDLLNVNKEANLFVSDLATAEYSKYIDNSFHALKVAYANEIFHIGMKHGIDVATAHAFFVQDTRLNISPYYLRPGLPFGGSCLPKDLRELQYLIKKTGSSYPLVEHIIPSNDAYLKTICGKVMEHGHKRITFLGLSFKQNTDDLRESPALRILNELNSIGGFDIKILDPDLTVENLRIDFPYLFTMITNPETAINETDLLVVTKKYPELKNRFSEKGVEVIDFTDYNNGLRD